MMSGVCDRCKECLIDCSCRSTYILKNICGSGCPCKQNDLYTHLNLIKKSKKERIDLPSELPEIKYINIRGRAEHEAVVKDSALCEDLGLDQIYETMVYLRKWGEWLNP